MSLKAGQFLIQYELPRACFNASLHCSSDASHKSGISFTLFLESGVFFPPNKVVFKESKHIEMYRVEIETLFLSPNSTAQCCLLLSLIPLFPEISVPKHKYTDTQSSIDILL